MTKTDSGQRLHHILYKAIMLSANLLFYGVSCNSRVTTFRTFSYTKNFQMHHT